MARRIHWDVTHKTRCSRCGKVQEFVFVSLPAPEELRTHGSISERVGWLGCPECDPFLQGKKRPLTRNKK